MIRTILVAFVVSLILVSSFTGCKQGNSSSEAAELDKPVPEGWTKFSHNMGYFECWLPGDQVRSSNPVVCSSQSLGLTALITVGPEISRHIEYVYPRRKPVDDNLSKNFLSQTTGKKVDWCGLEAIETETIYAKKKGSIGPEKIITRKCDLGMTVIFANLSGDADKLTAEACKNFFGSFRFDIKKQIVVDRPDMTEADKDWKDRLFGITEIGTEFRLIKETQQPTPNLNDRMLVHIEAQVRQVKDSFAEKDFARIMTSGPVPADLGVLGTFDPQLEKFLREPLSKTPEGGIVEIFIPESLTKDLHLIGGEFGRLKVKLIKIISD